MAKRPYHTIQEQFDEYRAANPHVYNYLVAEARRFVASGYNFLTIALLVELFRCDPAVRSRGRDYYKFSNDYRSRYARLIMEQEADLQGIFNIKQLEAA